MKESRFKKHINSLKNRRLKVISDICDYLNVEFKNATIKYENDNFIIEGNTEESEEIKAYIEDLIEFSREKRLKMENKLYRHYKNKRLYTITGECIIQLNGEWRQAVIYCLYEGDGQLFCRERSEFMNKFKLEE